MCVCVWQWNIQKSFTKIPDICYITNWYQKQSKNSYKKSFCQRVVQQTRFKRWLDENNFLSTTSFWQKCWKELIMSSVGNGWSVIRCKYILHMIMYMYQQKYASISKSHIKLYLLHQPDTMTCRKNSSGISLLCMVVNLV